MYSERCLTSGDDDLEEVKCKTEIFKTRNELLQKKKLFNNLASKLPDRGAKLKKDVEKLESKLKDLELKVQGSKSEENSEEEDYRSVKDEREISERAKSTKQLCSPIETLCSEIESVKISKSKSADKVGDVNPAKGIDSRGKRETCEDKVRTNATSNEPPEKGNRKIQHKPAKSDKSACDGSITASENKMSHDVKIQEKKKDSNGKNLDAIAEARFTNSGDTDVQSSLEELNKPCSGTKKKTFLNVCNITLKKKGNEDVEPRKTQVTSHNEKINSHVAKNKEYGAKLSNIDQENLSFSGLRKEFESRAVESLSLDNAKHGSWKDWRDGARQTKLTEAQPLTVPSKTSNPQENNCVGTYSAGLSKKNRVKTEEVAKLHDLLKSCPSEVEETDDPEGLKTKLMKHQKRALAWLLWREDQTPSGGIFADDMGLGKTLTMLSLILKQNSSPCATQCETMKGTIPAKATLIICLASIVHQWSAEVQKHCKKDVLKVLVYHGKGREKNLENVAYYDVVVTTYGIIASEGKSITSGSRNVPQLFKIHWERIILDEAHNIKNHKSVTAECVYFLKASRKWAVTGTPIHNNVKDLYSLLKFLRYSPFDDYKTWRNLVGDDAFQNVERRNTLIKSILFRRSKEQCDETGKPIVQLSKKVVINHELKLSEDEQKIYDTLYDKLKTKMINYFDAKDRRSSGNFHCRDSGNQNLLVLLLRLQQCCNHISLLKGAVEDDVTFNESDVSSIADSIASMSISEDSSSSEMSADVSLCLDEVGDKFSVSFPSTKIKALFKELRKIEESDKKQKSVVVSQWVAMLEIVEHHLKEHNIRYSIIRGNTKPEGRTKASTDFNENPNGPKVMLLSLKAGGVGLNLIGGNHLFLLDHHWNPALESQASDRIYRVGQSRDVFIHKFVCIDSVEIKIARLQEEKSNVAKSALEGGKNVVNRLSFDDLKRLFGINT